MENLALYCGELIDRTSRLRKSGLQGPKSRCGGPVLRGYRSGSSRHGSGPAQAAPAAPRLPRRRLARRARAARGAGRGGGQAAGPWARRCGGGFVPGGHLDHSIIFFKREGPSVHACSSRLHPGATTSEPVGSSAACMCGNGCMSTDGGFQAVRAAGENLQIRTLLF